ncbi:MAG TPA: hypothetical protein DEF41_12040 [Desulfovibrio sp.]|nr:hypothetical protein [Desulfovibrio sp.]
MKKVICVLSNALVIQFMVLHDVGLRKEVVLWYDSKRHDGVSRVKRF